MNQDIQKLLKAALECSFFINPNDPGLTGQELAEVGARAGYLPGETRDAANSIGQTRYGQRFVTLGKHDHHDWVFYFPEEPEYRNFTAFDFVVSQLNERVKIDGMRDAQIERGVMIERALEANISRHDIELAIAYQVEIEHLSELDGVLRFPKNNQGVRSLPSSFRANHSNRQRNHEREKAFLIVKDLISRRNDGRTTQIEPLDAFAGQLDKLSFGMFRLWWMQTVGELRRCDANSSPVAVSVLAAALVEGALTFVVKHARNLNLGVFRSTDFSGDPRSWKIDDLIKSAASGGIDAVLDLQTKNRAETLCRVRQRIHAGRMLSEHPAGVPDLRPEEARDAKATADKVVRSVIDWLEKYPPT